MKLLDHSTLTWNFKAEADPGTAGRAIPYPRGRVAMGLQGKLGTIELGMIVDIVILDADPSENIAVLGDPAHVRAVLKGGKPVDLAS